MSFSLPTIALASCQLRACNLPCRDPVMFLVSFAGQKVANNEWNARMPEELSANLSQLFLSNYEWKSRELSQLIRCASVLHDLDVVIVDSAIRLLVERQMDWCLLDVSTALCSLNEISGRRNVALPRGFGYAVCSVLYREMKDDPSHAATAIWAFSKLVDPPSSIWRIASSKDLLSRVDSVGLSRLSVAASSRLFSEMNRRDKLKVLDEISSLIAGSNSLKFGNQAIANISWALARSTKVRLCGDRNHKHAMERLASMAPTIEKFTPAQLASYLWACAVINVDQPPKLEEGKTRVDFSRFQSREICNLIWALSHWPQSELGVNLLHRAVERMDYLIQTRPRDFSPEDLSSTAKRIAIVSLAQSHCGDLNKLEVA